MINKEVSMQQIEGGRASFAFQEVKGAVEFLKAQDKVKLYSSYLKRLPSMIQVNGLGQALAFYYSKRKGKNEYELIYRSLSNWVLSKPMYAKEPKKELVEVVVEMNSEHYRMVTSEILALLDWMRKFATGMSDEENGV